jgi:hypothetical protein
MIAISSKFVAQPGFHPLSFPPFRALFSSISQGTGWFETNKASGGVCSELSPNGMLTSLEASGACNKLFGHF